MRLSTFIAANKEPILQAWEEFARSISAAQKMDRGALRDHASLMLDTIINDLNSPQSTGEQERKSRGHGKQNEFESHAERHAAQRLCSGYSIDQLVAEYRALRASVLKLWALASESDLITHPFDVSRFNEAIDQALAESVSRFNDIVTEQSENERHRLEAILQAAPVGIVVADKDGKVILANEESKRIWGVRPRPENVHGYAAFEGWWADGSEKHGQPIKPLEWPLARALQGDEIDQDVIEIQSMAHPGERTTVSIRAAPIRDSLNSIIGSVVAQTDITVNLRTQDDLRNSEAKFRTIANAMPQMVWSTQPDGHHDYYNQQWYDFTGVSAGSTDGNGWNALFHPDDQARAWELWRHSLSTGAIYEIEYRLRHRSGEYRWTLGRALPVKDADGNIIRWMGTCTDIHVHKLLENRLEQQSRLKDEFLAMLAHELRNPLAPISSAAEVLSLVAPQAENVKKMSEIIMRQVTHMTALIDDLLDVSRVNSGLVVLEKTVVDLRRVVDDAVEQATPLIKSKRHRLEVQLPPHPVLIEGDKVRLVQIVGNMLTNAAKYTSDEGHIWVEMKTQGGQVILSLKDNGIGMSAELVGRVFDLFVQSQRTSDRSSGGLGLGLALVKKLVELHFGSVLAVSPGVGKGSQFTVRLPLLKNFAEAPDSFESPTKLATPMRPLKIMMVEDNADAALTLSLLLRSSGHLVSIEHKSERAVERALLEAPDVFLLDIGLPNMDGNELAKQLRARPETSKALLIAISGYGSEAAKKTSVAAGFDHYLVKPIDNAKLFELLSNVSLGKRT